MGMKGQMGRNRQVEMGRQMEEKWTDRWGWTDRQGWVGGWGNELAGGWLRCLTVSPGDPFWGHRHPCVASRWERLGRMQLSPYGHGR